MTQREIVTKILKLCNEGELYQLRGDYSQSKTILEKIKIITNEIIDIDFKNDLIEYVNNFIIQENSKISS